MATSLAKTKLFFALGKQLGYEPEVLKERAKTKFNLASFNDIRDEQLDELIGVLQEKQTEVEKSLDTEPCQHEYECLKCGKKITIIEG